MKQHCSVFLGSLFLLTLTVSCGSLRKEDSEMNQLVSGITLENIDSTTNPADDFFKFVNGKWLNSVEIPPDQGSWGSGKELEEANNSVVLGVLKSATQSHEFKDGSDERKAADFFKEGDGMWRPDSIRVKIW